MDSRHAQLDDVIRRLDEILAVLRMSAMTRGELDALERRVKQLERDRP